MLFCENILKKRFYCGTSAKDKPINVLPFSFFYETDTNKLYIFDGSSWVIYSSSSSSNNTSDITLNYLTDSVSVNAVNKSGIITSTMLNLNNITSTTTSEIIDARGYNAILIQTIITNNKNWTTNIIGSFEYNGTYVNISEVTNNTLNLLNFQSNNNTMVCFKGIPDWIKIVATENEDGGTYSANAQLINL